MSIISQVGVVILIVFIVAVLILANRNLKKASEEGENFVDEWALREEKKEELRQKREEKKLLLQQEKEQKALAKKARKEQKETRLTLNEEKIFQDERENQETDMRRNRDAGDWDRLEQESWERSGQSGYENETDWLSDYEKAVDRPQEREQPIPGKIIPITKRVTTGITLVKLDENHRVMARYRIGQTPFTIGRGNNNNLVLDDLMVARRHCQIIERDGGYVLEDLGSSNKLYINGMVTTQAPLSDGLRVYIGNEEFQIEMEGGRSQHTRLYGNVGTGNYL